MEIKCDHLLISLSAVNATRYVDCWSCCLSILAMIISLIQWTSDDKSAGLFLYFSFIFIIHSLRIHQKCTRVCVVFSDISSGRVRCSFSVVISFFQLNSTWCFIRPVVRLVDSSDDWRSLFFHLLSSSGSHHIHTEHLFIHIVDSVDAVAGYKLWNSQYIWKCASTRVVFAALQISLYFSLAVSFSPQPLTLGAWSTAED